MLGRICFTLTLLIFLSGCAEFRPSWIDENSFETSTENNSEGNLGGHFEGEVWVPDNPAIEWTYALPDISSGILFDITQRDVTPTIQVEIVEFDAPWKYLSTFKFDFGVGYQRTYGYLGVKLTSIFEISAGVVAGWNWETNDYFYGPAFTIIKF